MLIKTAIVRSDMLETSMELNGAVWTSPNYRMNLSGIDFDLKVYGGEIEFGGYGHCRYYPISFEDLCPLQMSSYRCQLQMSYRNVHFESYKYCGTAIEV